MKRFDQVAGTWDAEQRRVLMAKNIFESIEQKVTLSSEMKVVDIGAGTGLLLFHFPDLVKEITGVDNSEKMLEELNKKAVSNKHTNVKALFFNADSDKLPVKEYDLAVSSMTFHHILNYESFMKDVYESLKVGGKICIADLVTEDGSFHTNKFDDVKYLGFDMDEFSNKLEDVGFKNIDVKIIYEIKRHDKTYPIFLAYGEK